MESDHTAEREVEKYQKLKIKKQNDIAKFKNGEETERVHHEGTKYEKGVKPQSKIGNSGFTWIPGQARNDRKGRRNCRDPNGTSQ